MGNAFAYCAPVAPFRNPLKPIPSLQGVTTIGGHSLSGAADQGLVEAIVCAAGVPGGTPGTGGPGADNNLLQYLCRDPGSPDSWSLKAFAGNWSLAEAIVTAVTGPDIGDVNFLWIDTLNNLCQASMTGQETFTSPTVVYPNSGGQVLTNLHVAYTPVAGDPPSGGSPVVYFARQSGSTTYLVTVQQTNGSWTATEYTFPFGTNLAWNDFVLVVNPSVAGVTRFWVLAMSSNQIGLWTGYLGVLSTLSQTAGILYEEGITPPFQPPPGLSDPPMSGSLAQIAAAVANPGAPAPAPCAFYIDSESNFMMWPSLATTVTPLPMPDGNVVKAWGTVSPGGRLASLYALTGNGWTFALGQMMWVYDSLLPLFAPPSLVDSTSGLSALAPLSTPGEIPALFGVTPQGDMFLFELNAKGTWNEGYVSGQWGRTPLLPGELTAYLGTQTPS